MALKADPNRTTNSAPQATETTDDGGFTMESASVSFTPAPADTTEVARAEEPPVREEIVAEEAVTGDVEQESVGASAAKPAVAAKTTAAKPAAKPKGLAGRRDVLQGDVDRLTSTRTKAQRDLDDLNTQIAARRKELETGQPATKPAATAAKPATKEAAKPADMPEPPKYRDFATDEEYETAMAKWRGDVSTWNTANLAAVREEVLGAVDSRFSKADEARGAEAADRAVDARLVAARESHADWDTVAENLVGLRSTWFDPEKHGDVETPFLSELTYYNEGDGAEVPYFIGQQDDDTRQAIADLLPSKALRDALCFAPSVVPLLAHFVTEEGSRDWESFRRMHPIRLATAIGSLHARLTAADDSSPAPTARHTTTKATAPAKLPVARAGAKSAAIPAARQNFSDWNDSEDAADLERRKKLAGLSA